MRKDLAQLSDLSDARVIGHLAVAGGKNRVGHAAAAGQQDHRALLGDVGQHLVDGYLAAAGEDGH